MRIHRFYLEDFFAEPELEIKDVSLLHQMRKVLRLKPGEFLSFFNEEVAAFYEIVSLDSKRAVFFKKEEEKIVNKEINKITLFQAILKGDKMSWIAQKATELGVERLVPVISQRSEKKDVNLERLKRISLEATEQCGRHDLITIDEPISFSQTVKDLKGSSFLGDASGEPLSKTLLSGQIKETINIFIGPEGGWTTEEISLAKDNKIKVSSLNNFILRSETAALAFISLLSNF